MQSEEGWVQCDQCERWVHQICGLFNKGRNSQTTHYMCPICLQQGASGRSLCIGLAAVKQCHLREAEKQSKFESESKSSGESKSYSKTKGLREQESACKRARERVQASERARIVLSELASTRGIWW